MTTAILYGLAASSALVIGAAIGALTPRRELLTQVLLAFAAGALISALSFELFEEAFELGGATRSGLALLAGAGAFIVADAVLDHYFPADDPLEGKQRRKVSNQGAGWALLAAVTLDGIPENAALGVSLVEDASLSLLVAIFFSNLPESLAGAARMREGGQSVRSVMAVWTGCALLLAAAVAIGNAFGEFLSDEILSMALGFAGGAVLASLANTVMPQAYSKGHPWIAFATAAGFLLSYLLAA